MRSGFRLIWRYPVFASAVIATFALAIGANAAIFSFVHALLLRPFPFRDPDQLVEIHSERLGQRGKLSMREILDIRERVPLVEEIAAYNDGGGGYNYAANGRPEEWRAALVTGNLFEVLGTPLQLGHKWNQDFDEKRNFGVVLSHGVWQRRFGGQRDVVGKSIALDFNEGYSIYGSVGPSFDYPSGIDVYRSIGGFTSYDRRDRRNVIGVARVRRPASATELQAQLDLVAQRLGHEYPDSNAGLGLRAIPLRELYVGDVRGYLFLLSGAVGFVLLIACSNVVNLLLARAVAREREVAVRVALGASRMDLLKQLLSETCTLALAGGLLGIALAYWAIRALRATIGAEVPGWLEVKLDLNALLFVIAASLLAGLLAGVAPAWQLARESLAETLSAAARGSSGGRRTAQLRGTVVGIQVALAVMLLAGAGTMIRAFGSLLGRETGFSSKSLETFRVALGWRRYGNDKTVVPYFERAQERLTAIAGVETVAFGSQPPLTRAGEEERNSVMKEGQPIAEALRNPYVIFQAVSENYFEAMQIPLRRGRMFTKFDQATSPRACVISERLASLLWPGGEDPIGKRLRYGVRASFNADTGDSANNNWWSVAGIVGNTRHASIFSDWSLDFYVPYRQYAVGNQYFLVRSKLASAEFERRAMEAMTLVDPEQSVFDFASYEERILSSIWQLRLSRLLLTLFAAVALTLAAIGIYGVMAHLVAQRHRELGIRLALGATPADVRGLILSQGLGLAAGGLVAGVIGAAASHLLLRELPGVQGVDVPSVFIAGVSLGAVTALACWLPALRASRLDPAMSLRSE